MSEGLPSRYRLLRRIGAGGMAEVFRAELQSAEGVTRDLVIKRVHPRLALDADAVQRFVDEARVAARLRHPHIVQVYEFGRTGDDCFLAMEFVEGCDLARLLRTVPGGRLPPAAALAVAGPLLDALDYVHSYAGPDGAPRGLVHRDVSPHNVLLGRAGEVKLADFGIAQATTDGAAGRDGVEGKLAYMSPEQARGEPVDARADLFAAAAVVREMLDGERPWADGEGSLRERASRGELRPVRAGPFAEVLARALAPGRDDRFASVGAFRDALRAAAEAAGMRADGDALRALVATASDAEVATEPAEPTLTAAGTATPDAAPVPVSPPNTRRRFVERVAIALCVLVVSVLAERRTRPAAPHRPNVAPVARAAPLRLAFASAAGVAWWVGERRSAMEDALGVPVAASAATDLPALARGLRGGEVDVALVPSEALRALVTTGAARRLDTLLAEVDGGGYLAVRADLRAEAMRWGASVGGEGEGTYSLPVAADLVAFGVRDDAVREYEACATEQRAGLDGWLAAHGGRRLPAGFIAARDADGWTTWDVAAAAWCWSRRGWTVELPGADGVQDVGATLAAWASLGANIDGTPPGPEALVRARPARELLAAAPVTAGAASPDADGTVVARWAPLSWWAAHGATGWRLGHPPQGVSLALDDVGDPEAEAARVLYGRTWGWAVGRGTARPARSARLVLALARTAPALARALGAWSSGASGVAPTGELTAFARRVVGQSPFVRIEGPASAEAVAAMPAELAALGAAGQR